MSRCRRRFRRKAQNIGKVEAERDKAPLFPPEPTAGIKNFRWHDLRHTWASWHMQQGTPLPLLQELGGWELPEMVRRYAHLSAEHLAPDAEKIARPRVVSAAPSVEANVVALRPKRQNVGNARGTNLAQPTGFCVTPEK